MDLKPKKPQKNLFGGLKPLDDAVAKSKDTPADTKALESASKELAAANKALGAAMEKSHKSYDKIFKMIPDVSKSSPGPIPIPYPVFSKLEKETKGAAQNTEKAHKKLEKVHRKLIKLIDQQIKTLKPAAKTSGSNEAATMKGLLSAKNIGKAQFAAWSLDVKTEGQNVAHFCDLVTKNHY